MFDLLPSIRWQDLVDIAIVSYIIYRAILLIRGTSAVQVLVGIVFISTIYFIARQFDLLALHYLLKTFLSSFFLIVIIVFQRDIRRALTQMGKTPFHKVIDVATRDIEEIIEAATHMAKRRIGALIVIERDTGLGDFIESGHPLDAVLSKELLISIFLPASPMHDGGVIISRGRVQTAGCVLPLSKNPFISKRYGTRHRAALGLSEETDAVILVVSEETQEISLVRQGAITTVHDEKALLRKLQDYVISGEVTGYPWKNWIGKTKAA